MGDKTNPKIILVGIVFAIFIKSLEASISYKFPNSGISLLFNDDRNGVEYSVIRDNQVLQRFKLDKSFTHSNIHRAPNGFRLLGNAGKVIQFEVVEDTPNLSIYRVTRNVTFGDVAEDCVDLNIGRISWYGAAESRWQYWPIEKAVYKNFSYNTKEEDSCAVIERYWLTSHGVFIFIDEDVPLFIDQNSEQHPNELCFIAKRQTPYGATRTSFTLNYQIGIAKNVREAHMAAVGKYLNKPTGIPDERMFRHPIWSTWARYKKQINESVVLEYADEILNSKFNNSQIEIDDFWETCYGSLTIDTKKFPNMRNLVNRLKAKGFRVTMWVHPFVNKDCTTWYREGLSKGYFVTNQLGNPDTKWWNSKPNQSAHIDFTKPAAAKWFTDRLQKIRNETGIESFKFDAGESSWLPADPILQGNQRLSPDLIADAFVRTVAQFGPMLEVRTARGTQDVPVFVRMLDKDTEWDWNNGLQTLITTLLQMNLNGYPFVLPDMIGGNGYANFSFEDNAPKYNINDSMPDKELFIRWTQANVFMPAMQYSFVPWDYDAETIEISLNMTRLHEKYTDLIISLAKNAVAIGEPINRPIWWIDPYDVVAQQIHDEFLLGNEILSAPVLMEGEVYRDIYLPYGKWMDGNNGTIYNGPKWLMRYPAPLNVLPYFIHVTP